jgi:hypothetical protein
MMRLHAQQARVALAECRREANTTHQVNTVFPPVISPDERDGRLEMETAIMQVDMTAIAYPLA